MLALHVTRQGSLSSHQMRRIPHLAETVSLQIQPHAAHIAAMASAIHMTYAVDWINWLQVFSALRLAW